MLGAHIPASAPVSSEDSMADIGLLASNPGAGGRPDVLGRAPERF